MKNILHKSQWVNIVFLSFDRKNWASSAFLARKCTRNIYKTFQEKKKSVKGKNFKALACNKEHFPSKQYF